MCARHVSGFTLIEMIIAIVIIGVGLAGVLTAFSTAVKSSTDPLIEKQMLAAAEEMMEEILLKPFTPAGVAPANSRRPCGPAVSRAAFDDVSDYHNYETTSICDIDGGAVAGLTGYEVKVTVVLNAAPATDLVGLPAGAVRKITVVVTRGGETLSLVGWRADFAS